MAVQEQKPPVNDPTEHIHILCREVTHHRDALLASGADYAALFGASASEYGLWLTQEHQPQTSYRVVPSRCKTLFDRIVSTYGDRAGEHFLQLVAAHEILALPARMHTADIPASVLPWITRCVQRMLDDLAAPRTGYFSHDNDPFAKDLAVCRLKMFPCGIEMVDTDMAFPRSALWKFGPAVGWQLGRALLAMGGNRPMLGSHIDRRAIREFNPKGYLRLYHAVADILRLRQNIRGLMAQAWLLDAAVGRVSPELAFLHDVPAAAGAVFFPAYGDDRAVADAIRMSPHRRKLYDAGEFKPCAYVMVWPRPALLRWAKNHPLTDG